MRAIAADNNGLSQSMREGLSLSAEAQSKRFTDPKSREYDSEVSMFIDFFNRYGGFRGYADSFRYAIGEDRLKWPVVSKNPHFTGDNNYSKNLSEYLIAYLSLGFGVDKDLTSVFRNAGVGTLDKRIPGYEIEAANVKAIANAHCSIRAAANAGLHMDRELGELQLGNFKDAVAHGGTRASCPIECTFSENKCKARF